MSYAISDDLGVWVVVPDGNFPTRIEAQRECDRRNHEDGCIDSQGNFLMLEMPEFNAFLARHRARPDCTCDERARAKQDTVFAATHAA